MNNKIIGLVGGNGSFASAYFYKLLLDKAVRDFGAKNNDDFPHVIIDSVPVLDFISDEKNKAISLKMIKNSILNLENKNVGSVTVLCNTIHVMYNELAKCFNKLNSLIKITCDETIKRKYEKVGVFATPITIKHDLYGAYLRKNNVEVVYPSSKLQKYHTKIIKQAISGAILSNGFEKLTREFILNNKLDAVILGCTELPLIFPKDKFDNVVDCLDVLADRLLLQYYREGTYE